MKDKSLKGLELICKKCNNVRTKITMESLPDDVQIEFKKMQKEITEFKWQIVTCVKCNETSLVSEYNNHS